MLSAASNFPSRQLSILNTPDFSVDIPSFNVSLPFLVQQQQKVKLEEFTDGLLKKLPFTKRQLFNPLIQLLQLITVESNSEIRQAMRKKEGYLRRLFLSESWGEWAESSTALGKIISSFIDYASSQTKLEVLLARLNIEDIQKANTQAVGLLKLVLPHTEKSTETSHRHFWNIAWDFITIMDRKISSILPFTQGVSAVQVETDLFKDYNSFKPSEYRECPPLQPDENLPESKAVAIPGVIYPREIPSQNTLCQMHQEIETIRIEFLEKNDRSRLNLAYNHMQAFGQSNSGFKYCEKQLIGLLQQLMQADLQAENVIRPIFKLFSVILLDAAKLSTPEMCLLTTYTHNISRNVLVSKTVLSEDSYDQTMTLFLQTINKFPNNKAMITSALDTGKKIFNRINNNHRDSFKAIAERYSHQCGAGTEEQKNSLELLRLFSQNDSCSSLAVYLKQYMSLLSIPTTLLFLSLIYFRNWRKDDISTHLLVSDNLTRSSSDLSSSMSSLSIEYATSSSQFSANPHNNTPSAPISSIEPSLSIFPLAEAEDKDESTYLQPVSEPLMRLPETPYSIGTSSFYSTRRKIYTGDQKSPGSDTEIENVFTRSASPERTLPSSNEMSDFTRSPVSSSFASSLSHSPMQAARSRSNSLPFFSPPRNSSNSQLSLGSSSNLSPLPSPLTSKKEPTKQKRKSEKDHDSDGNHPKKPKSIDVDSRFPSSSSREVKSKGPVSSLRNQGSTSTKKSTSEIKLSSYKGKVIGKKNATTSNSSSVQTTISGLSSSSSLNRLTTHPSLHKPAR